MRTTNVNGINISYPNEISFCFNPEILTISGYTNITTIFISNRSKVYSLTLEPYNEVASFNISEITKLFFCIDNLFVCTGELLTVKLEQDGELVFSFDVFCIWGSLSVGERFNDSREIVWFRNLPFTVSFYTSKGWSIYKSSDGDRYSGVNGDTPQMIYQIDPLTLFDPQKYGMIMVEGESVGTFDYTFDLTFDGVSEYSTEIKLVPNDCTDGIYLRWIDKHGFVQYYLFKSGEKTNNTTNGGETIFIDYKAEDMNYEGISRQQSKEVMNSHKIYAPLVSQNEFAFLEGAYISPVVDWYVGKDDLGKDIWCPVNIQSGSLVKENRELQDFIMVINYPSFIMQKL